jgi:hypothetical protein
MRRCAFRCGAALDFEDAAGCHSRALRKHDGDTVMSAETSSADWVPQGGGCDCGTIRYRLEDRPLIVHCCHCRWCQRESGSAFALNAMIESDRVSELAGKPDIVDTPSASGLGQRVARCPQCRVAVWSHYAGAGPVTRFVRVGTLDDPDVLPPDIHIFTSSRQPWFALPGDAVAVTEYYDRKEYWREDSLRRYEALRPAIEDFRKRRREARP